VEIRARDVMSRDPTTVRPETPVEELIQLFRVSHYSGLPVVDEQGRAVGIISETDILRALAYIVGPSGSGEFKVAFAKGRTGITARLLEAGGREGVEALSVMRELLTRTVAELMTPVVHTCHADDLLASVCDTMVWKEIHRVVVVDDDSRVIGLISSLDAVRRLGELLRGKQGSA
jgi:CBS domain-containing protein